MELEERSERILIVDDDELIRRNVRRILRLAGFTDVHEAGDGSDAIFVAHVCQPDFVLLDAEMPLLNGEAAAPLIRNQAPDARIIAFSGKLVETPRWADAYLSKKATSLLDCFVEVVAWSRKHPCVSQEV